MNEKQSRLPNRKPVPMRRKLRKYEYTVNTPQYLEGMDQTMILINKAFRKEISSVYVKIHAEGIKSGLNEVGMAYLIKRLEDYDFPHLKEWNSKTLNLFIRAKHFDNSLVLKGSTTYLKTLKEYDMKEVEAVYRAITDKVIKKISVLVYVSYLKVSNKFLAYTRVHCDFVAPNPASCVYFKDDIRKAIDSNDFRVSHHKVNNLLSDLLFYL